jgi:hypothetical protein
VPGKILLDMVGPTSKGTVVATSAEVGKNLVWTSQRWSCLVSNWKLRVEGGLPRCALTKSVSTLNAAWGRVRQLYLSRRTMHVSWESWQSCLIDWLEATFELD